MARRRPGQGKNSWYDPTYWCHECARCGRRGTRDYMPQFQRDQQEWEERGSYASSLQKYGSAVVCRWTVACGRRSSAQLAAKEAAEAAEQAEAAAAGIVTARPPVDLDDLQEQVPIEPAMPPAGAQMVLWDFSASA
ncbi:hypothetical protein NWFMUON74_72170 (plasmid) [Nocardia wallacei]|uniref:Uncharacterized protein n=2 Tax=Nocardia wallacei TaxID=480035 RepID=A0A7G1KW00_9NOCA|nr:hypothetical protein NWFMUON74_72170 [Nocardia wallacei]